MNGKKYYGHSKSGETTDKWQNLANHLAGVAGKAAVFAGKFDSADWAWNAGWLHDIGKLDDLFQAYLLRCNGMNDPDYDNSVNGRINHSSAGAALSELLFPGLFSRPYSNICAGHHAGLPDYHPDNTGNAALTIRLREGRTNLDRIAGRFEEYLTEIKKDAKVPAYVKSDTFHLWVRILYSALVDADFLDTEEFLDPDKKALRSGFKPIAELKKMFDRYMNGKRAASSMTKVNQIRAQIFDACVRAGSGAGGVFSLTVPTGGGKTLSSMAFALTHALKQGKDRIVYVIPYTSIIEQTAAEFKFIFGPDQVVEHHSNIDSENSTPQSQLAAENWDAPIIVTTNVQFFESLYASRNSRCRKLHNIVNSVVILDEAQLLPPQLLFPCVDAINQLTEHYRVSLLLCTATQPCLPKINTPIEIAPDPASLYLNLRRTNIEFPADMSQPRTWEEISDELAEFDQVLAVVNSRRDCYDLFKLMPENTIHLSALMCGEHRSRIIQLIKGKLKNEEQVRVISTQLVEAGVDIDFPVVYRALAGLDSIVQTAGRCNREGKLDTPGLVKVFVPPKQAPRGLLRKGEDTLRSRLATKDLDPQNPEEYKDYFREFYSKINDDGRNWLRELLQGQSLECSFRTAGNQFSLIDDSGQQSVLVQYQGNEEFLHELRYAGPQKRILRGLQRYTVNLSRRDFEQSRQNGLLEEISSDIWLWSGLYSEVYGLDLFGQGWAVEHFIN